jgi:integrase
MGVRIDDKMVREMVPPASGNRIVYDDPKQGPRNSEGVSGFGIRITAAGARSWVLNYRNAEGRERRHTFGHFPELSVEAARKKAKALRGEIKGQGKDPRAERAALLAAPKVSDLCDYYIEQHIPDKRAASGADDKTMIDKIIRPKLGAELVKSIDRAAVVKLHRSLSATPYRANRVLSLLSKMFSLAIVDLGWRGDNPAKGVKRNEEQKRERYLTGPEIAKLTQALADHDDQSVANIVRLLLLTGARRGEVLQMEWSQLDLDAGVWVKPSAMTKQKTVHRVPLSDGALALLKGIHASALRDDDGNISSQYVFPGPKSGAPRTEIKDEWRAIAIKAGLYDLKPGKGAKPIKVVNCRLHDLRHTYASLLVSAGLSLPIIGALLGHTQASTTHRYAHLMDDPLRAATNTVSAVVTGKKSADVAQIGERVA